MRFVWLLLLGACVGGSSTSPQWPKLHERDTDGGESLAPHVAGATAVVAASTDEDKPADAAVVTPAVTPATTTPVATPPTLTPPPTDEPIQTEEITIEIDD